MSKTVNETHITGQKGVNLFERYCLQHQPVIIFRETLKSDFGIDAEIEMTERTEIGKIQPTGETIKVQIKTGRSYIRNERTDSFEFYASEDDIEYWTKYKTHGFDVLLIVIDPDEEKIYCKKVIDTDLGVAKTSLKQKKNFPIYYDKLNNQLEIGTHNFREKFSDTFRSRVNYSITETIVSNLMRFQKAPRIMYAYQSKFKDRRAITDLLKDNDSLSYNDCPFFIAYGSKVYTFNKLGANFSKFINGVLIDGVPELIRFQEILDNQVYRRHYVELLKEYIKFNVKRKRLGYHPRYKRFYFRCDPEVDTIPMEVGARTRKRDIATTKKVVTHHSYGKDAFYRHLAFSLNFQFVEGEIYVALGHKYLFTEDGWRTLEPDLITKFTNYLTARDFNDRYYDLLRFWWNYLSNDNDTWIVFELDSVQIILEPYYCERVPFGIPLENKTEKKKLRTRVKRQPYQNPNQLFS